MNLIKENQKIKIIPDRIDKIAVGFIISACRESFVAEINNPSSLIPGSSPEILISGEDYMVMFTSKVNKTVRNNVWFSIPSKFTFIQKREYPRINVNLPVSLKQSNETPETQAVTANIGGGGMQIVSSADFELNSVLNAKFNLSNKKEINTSLEILRRKEEDEKFFLSGKFNKISNFDKTSIIQFCFKHQLELKCKK